jgi:hypothetical protein
VLAYLRCTSDFRIEGPRVESNTVKYYSDSDHAGDKKVTMFSRTGSMILLNNVPIYWKSHLQGSGHSGIACSSAVAEIYALYDTIKVSRLYAWRCQELGMSDVTLPVHIQVDNQQAVSFANSTCLNSRIRGTIDMREAWVDECKDRGQCSVSYVSTVDNVADLLTKCVREGRHKQLMGKLQGEKEEKKT